MSATRYLVARLGPAVYVRVAGMATMKTSPVLDGFLRGELNTGASRCCLDLSECGGMDSTFMGLLVLSADLFRDAGGELVIVNPAAGALRLLQMLGVSEVVTVIDVDRLPALEFAVLEGRADAAPLQRMELVRAAHERLVRMSDANKAKFAAFLEALGRDLDKARRAAPNTSGPSGSNPTPPPATRAPAAAAPAAPASAPAPNAGSPPPA